MNITSFIIYCFIVTFTPGPTNIVILSTVHNFGTRKAMEYTYGATVAFGLLLVVSAFLNSVLYTIIPKLLMVMQIIGSLYMIYLAVQIYKSDSAKGNLINNTGTFLSGFIMQFVNPKVILFTMTIIPSYIMPYFQSASALMTSIAGITFIGFLAFITWVLFGAIFKAFLQKHKKAVNLLMALFLVNAAGMMWF
ncbi:LysE family transporter [Niallia taxi]|uniref:LysE family translocator n=1 Tax=Niallia taxi TaxID=2499688 RepID=UPI003981D756